MNISGHTTTPDATPVRTIAIPLPVDGAWSITGKVLAVDNASGRSRSVVFFPDISGYCVAGVAHENDGLAGVYPTSPTAGYGVDGVGIAPVLTGAGPDAPVCEIQLTGADGMTIAWGWELDVASLGL